MANKYSLFLHLHLHRFSCRDFRSPSFVVTLSARPFPGHLFRDRSFSRSCSRSHPRSRSRSCSRCWAHPLASPSLGAELKFRTFLFALLVDTAPSLEPGFGVGGVLPEALRFLAARAARAVRVLFRVGIAGSVSREREVELAL